MSVLLSFFRLVIIVLWCVGLLVLFSFSVRCRWVSGVCRLCEMFVNISLCLCVFWCSDFLVVFSVLVSLCILCGVLCS